MAGGLEQACRGSLGAGAEDQVVWCSSRAGWGKKKHREQTPGAMPRLAPKARHKDKQHVKIY